VNVEIKAPRALSAGMGRLTGAVARIVARHGAADRVLVSSFNPIALGLMRLAAPRVATGLLFAAEQRRPLREAWARHLVRPAAVHPERVLVDEERIATWRREGRAVNVWTVDDEAEIVRLARLGVDGIITNDPAATRAIVDRAHLAAS
jgi:glycerophosphoryl diester phosphodiesterase